jgi:serine protease Do
MEPGDVITKADGKAVDRVNELQRVIRSKKPGETVEVEAMRYGTRKTFRVRLTAAPSPTETVADAAPSAPATPPVSSRLGISVEPVSAELIRAVQLPAEYRGLRVAAVEPGSPAQERGLLVGDVLVQLLPARTDIRTPSDLQRALDGVKPGEVVSFLVYRPGPNGAGQTRVVNIRTN